MQKRMTFKQTAEMAVEGIARLDKAASCAERRIGEIKTERIESGKIRVRSEFGLIGEMGRAKFFAARGEPENEFAAIAGKSAHAHSQEIRNNYRENIGLLNVQAYNAGLKQIFSWIAGVGGSVFSFSIPLTKSFSATTMTNWAIGVGGTALSFGVAAILRLHSKKTYERIIRHVGEGERVLENRINKTGSVIGIDEMKIIAEIRNAKEEDGGAN